MMAPRPWAWNGALFPAEPLPLVFATDVEFAPVFGVAPPAGGRMRCS